MAVPAVSKSPALAEISNQGTTAVDVQKCLFFSPNAWGIFGDKAFTKDRKTWGFVKKKKTPLK